MIRGYFSGSANAQRPFVNCAIAFPERPNLGSVSVEFLVDTGADVTILSPLDVMDIGLDVDSLELGPPSTGLGGSTPMRVVDAQLDVQDYSISLKLHIPEAQNPIPSLLGRDFISAFALFFQQRTKTLVLLDEAEVQSLGLNVL